MHRGVTTRRAAREAPSATGDVPILVVDDDANFRTAVTRTLASTPFRRFAVRGGVDALRFLANASPFEDAPRPAFVVLDFNLPDLGAPAVVADMRAHPLHHAIPVIVLSQIPGRPTPAPCSRPARRRTRRNPVRG